MVQRDLCSSRKQDQSPAWHSGLRDPALPQLQQLVAAEARIQSLPWEFHMPQGSQKRRGKKKKKRKRVQPATDQHGPMFPIHRAKSLLGTQGLHFLAPLASEWEQGLHCPAALATECHHMSCQWNVSGRDICHFQIDLVEY